MFSKKISGLCDFLSNFALRFDNFVHSSLFSPKA
jgi:hypothetical protein